MKFGSHSLSFRARAVAALAAVALVGGLAVTATPASATAPSYQLSIFAGTGHYAAPTPGPAAASALSWVQGEAFDSSGNLYIADGDAAVIEKITPGGTLSIVAGTGVSGEPTAGPVAESPLKYPVAVALDSTGNLYISDAGTSQILKVTTGGTLSIIAGTGARGLPTPGPAASSMLSNPCGIAVDSSGNVYVADNNNGMVEKITPGGTLSIFAGKRYFQGIVPTPGPATDTALFSPFGITVDSSDNVYVADTTVVEKITSDGTLSIIAGTGTSGAPTPGPATSSAFRMAAGIAVDAAGTAFVADYDAHVVAKVTIDGTLSIIAGMIDRQGHPAAGAATATSLGGPLGLAIDSSGNITVADADSMRILKLAPPVPTRPGVPTVVATAGDASASIAVSVEDNGSAITKLQYKVGDGSWIDAPGTTSPIAISGLSNYVTAQIRVRAVNSIGTGPVSAPVSVRPRFTGPTITGATVTGRRSAHVTYTGVTIPGARFSGYNVTAYLKGTTTAVASCQTGVNGRACDLVSLSPNTKYDIRAQAYLTLTGDPTTRETLQSASSTVTTTA